MLLLCTYFADDRIEVCGNQNSMVLGGVSIVATSAKRTLRVLVSALPLVLKTVNLANCLITKHFTDILYRLVLSRGVLWRRLTLGMKLPNWVLRKLKINAPLVSLQRIEIAPPSILGGNLQVQGSNGRNL